VHGGVTNYARNQKCYLDCLLLMLDIHGFEWFSVYIYGFVEKKGEKLLISLLSGRHKIIKRHEKKYATGLDIHLYAFFSTLYAPVYIDQKP
jgi:hypothetical protein